MVQPAAAHAFMATRSAREDARLLAQFTWQTSSTLCDCCHQQDLLAASQPADSYRGIRGGVLYCQRRCVPVHDQFRLGPQVSTAAHKCNCSAKTATA